MILNIHPKSKKVTIEIPEELVGKDLQIEIKPKKSLRGILKVKETKDESNAWLKWVKNNYDKS